MLGLLEELVKASLSDLQLKASLLIYTVVFDIPHGNSEGISWQPRDMLCSLHSVKNVVTLSLKINRFHRGESLASAGKASRPVSTWPTRLPADSQLEMGSGHFQLRPVFRSPQSPPWSASCIYTISLNLVASVKNPSQLGLL